MRTVVKIVTVLFVVGFGSSIAAEAAANDAIDVDVRVISASDEGDEVDDELQDIEGRLQRGFEDEGKTSFEQLDRHTRQIALNSSEDFELPTDDQLTLAYNGRADDFVRLGLTLHGRVSTTLRATPGSTFFQAGLRHGDNLLVLAITVED